MFKLCHREPHQSKLVLMFLDGTVAATFRCECGPKGFGFRKRLCDVLRIDQRDETERILNRNGMSMLGEAA